MPVAVAYILAALSEYPAAIAWSYAARSKPGVVLAACALLIMELSPVSKASLILDVSNVASPNTTSFKRACA